MLCKRNDYDQFILIIIILKCLIIHWQRSLVAGLHKPGWLALLGRCLLSQYYMKRPR